MQLPVSMIAQGLGVDLADLSVVEDPRGRVDYLCSKIVEQAASQLTDPALVATYLTAKPLIDGLLVKHLGMIKVKIPKEILQNVFGKVDQL